MPPAADLRLGYVLGTAMAATGIDSSWFAAPAPGYGAGIGRGTGAGPASGSGSAPELGLGLSVWGFNFDSCR